MSDHMLVKASLKEIEAESIANIEEDMHRIYEIWNDLEFNIDYKCERATVIWGHMKDLIKNLYKTENTVYEDIKEQIANYRIKVIELSNALAVPINEPQGSLIEIKNMLKVELESLSKLKNKRITKYQKLKSEELKYCRLLKLPESFLPKNEAPTEKEIGNLRLQVEMLREEENGRREKLSLLKAEFIDLVEETSEVAPERTFEKEMLSGLGESVCDEAFEVVHGMIDKAQKKKEKMENEKRNLVDRLNVLWQRLKVDESRRIEFLSKHSGCRPSTISSIEQELERCITIKKENIASFVSELRIELSQLWDQCHVPPAEREKFHYFSATEVSEEVLEAHEAEVDKWKKYLAEVDHILKKIEKRQQLWEMMVVFENKANDPNRFKNRGGNLLKEEKQRKKVQKDLPALEDEIFSSIDTLKEKNGSIFFYRGEDFKTHVANQWSEMFPQKENKKPQKQQGNLLQFGNDSTLKTSSKKSSNQKENQNPAKQQGNLLQIDNDLTLKTPAKKPSSQKENQIPAKQQSNLLQIDNYSTIKTPAKKPLKIIPKTAPSKLLKPSVSVAISSTLTSSKSKAVPTAVGKVALKDAKLFHAKSNVVQIEDKNI